VVLLERVAQRVVEVDAITVPSALSLPADVAVLLEVADDLHRRALGDADELRDVAEPEVGCAGDREQHVGVVGEEGPVPAIEPIAHPANRIDQSS